MDLWKIDRLGAATTAQVPAFFIPKTPEEATLGWFGWGFATQVDSGDTPQDKAQIDAEAAAIALLAMAADPSQWIVTATLPNLMNEGLLHLANIFLEGEL